MQQVGKPRFLCRQIVWIACILVAGCQANGGVIERLDSDSGLTVVTDRRPIAFARTESRLSRSARDYVYLGPVEINERGTREYFLWVGIASTIDRDYLAASTSSPNRLYLVVEGAPVEFELEPWGDRIPGLASLRIYDPAVTPRQVLAGRVTRDQLALLSRADLASIRVAIEDGPTVEYFFWGQDEHWPAFASYAGLAREP
jgi:hypothetical protein